MFSQGSAEGPGPARVVVVVARMPERYARTRLPCSLMASRLVEPIFGQGEPDVFAVSGR